MELVAEDARIAALGAAGHGLSNEGKGLMTVQTAELDDSAIQLEAVVGELRFAEADSALFLIHQLHAAHEADVDGIEIRVSEVPEFDGAEIVQVHGVGDWLGCCVRG